MDNVYSYGFIYCDVSFKVLKYVSEHFGGPDRSVCLGLQGSLSTNAFRLGLYRPCSGVAGSNPRKT